MIERLLIRLSLFSAPLVLLLVAVNYFGDGGRIIRGEDSHKIEEILLSGTYCTNLSNFNDANFQQRYVAQLEGKYKTVVLGSSRALLLGNLLIPDSSLYNTSFTSASLEDVLGMYQYYTEHHPVPQKILLSIDPWMFNDEFAKEGFGEFHSAFLESQGIEVPGANNQKRNRSVLRVLFSLSYFQESVKEIPALIRGKRGPYATQEPYNEEMTILPDGSRTYPASYQNLSSLRKRIKIESYMNGRSHLEGFREVSPSRWDYFSHFVMQAMDKGIAVELLLFPYHPYAYEFVEADHPMVMQVEEKILVWAKEQQVPVHGSFDPEVLGMDDQAFFDAVHNNRFGVQTVLQHQAN